MPESGNLRGSSGPTTGAAGNRSASSSVPMPGGYRREAGRAPAPARSGRLGAAVVRGLVEDLAGGVEVVDPVREAVRIGDEEHVRHDGAHVALLDVLPARLEAEPAAAAAVVPVRVGDLLPARRVHQR